MRRLHTSQLVLPCRVETEDGDYMFCFDNTFSTVSDKLVFFELILDNMDTDEDPENWKEYVHGIDTLDMKLEDIMVCICLSVCFIYLFCQSVV